MKRTIDHCYIYPRRLAVKFLQNQVVLFAWKTNLQLPKKSRPDVGVAQL
jgi:hypothetical protein